MLMNCHSFETEPARRVDPGMKSGRVKKNEGRKNPVRPGQKPGCDSLAFVFFH